MTRCAQAVPTSGTATEDDARHQEGYKRRQPMSTPCRDFCCPDGSMTAEAVGALALYLVGKPLPTKERRLGWSLAERWLSELVTLRHGLKAEVA